MSHNNLNRNFGDSRRDSYASNRLSVNIDERSLMKEVVVKMCECGFKTTESDVRTKTKDVMQRFASFLTKNVITVDKIKADQKLFFTILHNAGCTKLNFKFTEQSLRNIGLPHYVKQSMVLLDCLVNQIYSLKDVDLFLGEIADFEALAELPNQEDLQFMNQIILKPLIGLYMTFMDGLEVDLHCGLYENDDENKTYENFMKKSSIPFIKHLINEKKVKLSENKINLNKKKSKVETSKDNRNILNELEQLDFTPFETQDFYEIFEKEKLEFERIKSENDAITSKFEECTSNIGKYQDIKDNLINLLKPVNISENNLDIDSIREKILQYNNLKGESYRGYSQKKSTVNSTIDVLRQKIAQIEKDLKFEEENLEKRNANIAELCNKKDLANLAIKELDRFNEIYNKIESQNRNAARDFKIKHTSLRSQFKELDQYILEEREKS